MGQVTVVAGAQFGSEGKGAVCASLSEPRRNPTQLIACRVNGPNAGHTVIDKTGRAWPLRTVPVAAAVNPEAQLVITAGSEIDLQVLNDELQSLDEAGFAATERLWIDAQATILEPKHIEQEHELNMSQSIGSTQKGIGAARSMRIMRKAAIVKDMISDMPIAAEHVTDTAKLLHDGLMQQAHVLIEGTQGYGLGLHAGYYPQCTSSDCRVIDILAAAGISPWSPFVSKLNAVLCARTYPIRVAGNSGPLANECSWEDLEKLTNGYIKPELTTVTHKVRRVGQFDAALVAAAVAHSGGSNARVALMFFDYLYPELAGSNTPGSLSAQHVEAINKIEYAIGAPIVMLGTGPSSVIWTSEL